MLSDELNVGVENEEVVYKCKNGFCIVGYLSTGMGSS